VANGQASTIDLTDKRFFVTGVTKTAVDGQVVLMPRSESIATGWKWSVQPAVSADRRYVQLRLTANQASLVEPVPMFPVITMITPTLADGSKGEPVPFTQYIQQPEVTCRDMQTTCAIPDGATALLSGWTTQRQVVQEYGPPVLSKVPYVNRLFKNVGYGRETEHVLVLVTPRIILHEEVEEVAPPATLITPEIGAAGALLGVYQEPKTTPSPKKETHASDPASASQKKVAKLLEKYHEACAEGRLEEAKKFARRALTLDPACFDKQAYAK
jgi:hypothetical protein